MATEQSKADRSSFAKERFRRAARKVKNYWIFTRSDILNLLFAGEVESRTCAASSRSDFFPQQQPGRDDYYKVDGDLIDKYTPAFWLISTGMSLLTVVRSPSSENTSIGTDSELDEDVEDGSPRSRTSSFEGFFASKGSAFALPDGDFARKASKHGGEMQTHLQSMVNLLRDDDILRLVVKLESQFPERVRYLTVVSAFNEDDVEESIAMGVDWKDSKSGCTIGLVVPLWRDTAIEFDGDGGFCLSTDYRRHIVKPVSVQTMWTAVQWIHRCADNARKNNHYPNGQSHMWTSFYSSRISSDQSCINEWLEMEDVSSRLAVLPTGTTPEQELMMKLIRHKLKEVMMKVDLEEVTCRQIRQNLEEEMQMNLKEYKQYIDEEMLTILGQLDYASQIYDHVYLGSEWNASNLEELKENGIGYILNISREIDNFFYGTFKYFNIRIYDEEDSDLMRYWDKAYKFINEAKNNGSKVLVHCKMGMSRSASTVIAYGMKEYGTSLNDTMKYVKSKRSVVNPNAGFWKQLITYEGILTSSKQRYNKLFTSGRRRINSADLEGRKSVKRRRNRRQKKFNTVALAGDTKLDQEIFIEEKHANTLERDLLSVEHEESDEDMDDKSSPSSGCDQSDEVLKDWEKTNVSSIPSSPSSSRPDSPDVSKDELEDQVGGLVPTSKVKSPKSPALHRAHSVPSLVGDASKSSDAASVEEKAEGLHRCNSLREFLSGKVAALKKDYKEQTLGRHSSSLESIEKKQKKKSSSPDKDSKDNTSTEVTVEKTKLHATLSDPTGITSTEEPVVKSEQEPVEGEKEDTGSVPDQIHSVVHRDAQDVVKSGTVKRQSKNFEEGKVNLPWDWEEALMELSSNEKVEKEGIQEQELTNAEEQVAPNDEPPAGLVKMHAQMFQGNYLQEGKNSGSEGEEEKENNVNSPEIEKTSESLQSSIFRKPVVVLDANSSPIVAETKESESDRIKEEMQKARALFEKDVKKVNEEMLQEKSKRRSFVSRKSKEVDDVEKLDSSNTVESLQETTPMNEDSQDVEEDLLGEDPVPGTVKKHLQAIEDKYKKTVSTELGVAEDEETSTSQMTKIEQESSVASKRVYIFPKSEENEVAKVENLSKSEAKSSEKDSFDVDVLLRRVNEDMKNEKEQRRAMGAPSSFKDFSTSTEEESIPIDVLPENENSESSKQQIESESSEVPRPGIVKRSTDLLLGKVRLDDVDKNQDELTITDEKDGGKVVESSSEKRADLQVVKDAGNTAAENDATEKGLVKRHALAYEGKLPSQVEEEEEKEDIASTAIEQSDAEDEKSTEDHIVDSSGFLSVKLRLKLMEEVIQGANEREYHKQRTRNALAALEDKRERIEIERRESENALKEIEKLKSKSSEIQDDSDTGGSTDGKKAFFIPGDDEDDLPKDSGTESTDDLNTEKSPCVGNVRLRTLLLEERIQGSTEDLTRTKSGPSIRRHESMPRTTRPVDRPIVRQRSLSDLNTGTMPSTSKGKSSPTNRWSLDKNRIAKLLGNQDKDVPDNDRDSEKLSDDMSEKSDKTEELLSKSADIFELVNKEPELSKEMIQIPDLDNKDIPSL